MCTGAVALTVRGVTDLHVNPQARSGPGQTGAAGQPRAPRRRAEGQAQFVDVVAIGDITVTGDSVILPQGRFPLASSTWTVRDSTRIIRRSPRYAVVLASVFGVTLVGLLFLLIKERHYGGAVLVTMVGEGFYHSVEFPPGPESTAHVASLVNRARALAAAATWAAVAPQIDA
jgi:hypothetical protein